MDIYRGAARLMAMDDAAWLRHASNWSVWSRVVTPLPLIALAVWSRVWLGWWALVPLILVAGWLWLNPRIFAPPPDLSGWAARGVMGERVFLHRRDSVAAQHQRAARALALVSALGLVPYAWGLWVYDFWAVACGTALIAGGKLWFVDRMAWVWADFLAAGGTAESLGKAKGA